MVLFIAISGVCLALSIHGYFYYGDESFVGLIVFEAAVFIAFFLLQLWLRPSKLERETQKIAEKKRVAEQKATFYNECVKNGVENCNNPKEIQKAILIARKMGLAFTDISALFEGSKNALAEADREQRALDLIDKKRAEQAEYAKLIKYAEYYGREKKAKMLEDEIRELQAGARSLKKDADLILRMGQEKETDWATMGGIASGIAGAGAGIATALDAQAKNAQIRAKNEAYVQAVIPAVMSFRSRASSKESTALKLQEELNDLQVKLISDLDTTHVFDLLTVRSAHVDVSETGAFTVTATVATKRELYIYVGTRAIADGTILAHIFEGEREIATAKMVLPMKGVSSNKGCKIVGMALSGAVPEHEYTVTFEGYKLWLMER